MNELPTIQELFALNANSAWRSRVNCYGLAVGVDHSEAMSREPDFMAHPGCFSRASSRPYLHELFHERAALFHYQLLTDGLAPIADPALEPAPKQVVAVCIANPGFHFFRRIDDGTWIHKSGTQPIKTCFLSQPRIIDIKHAIADYQDLIPDSVFGGFYEVTPSRPKLNGKLLPVSDPRCRDQLTSTLDGAAGDNSQLQRLVLREKRVLGLIP